MSKKAILSALLVSSALLGTTSANAATSALKDESKLVSVEKDGVKIFSNSKLESSKKVAKGTVYKVDGYRDINSKKYYRVYQQDTEGKNVYKGYVLAADAQDLKAGSVDKKDRFVGLTEDGQKAWENLYFNREIKTYNGKKHSSNFEVKRTYEVGGKKYFSVYRGEKWMGYMDGSAFKVLTPENVEEGKQAYTVAKDATTYKDIYFTTKGELKAGEKVTVKRVYTFGTGRKYASAYNEAGKWVGYVNLSLLSEDKVVDEETQKAIDAANDAIKKAEDILSKAQASKESKEAAQKVIDAAKETVKNGNLEDIKKVPSQIEEAIKALKPGATTIDIQRVEEAIEAGKEAIKEAEAQGVGSIDKANIEKVNKAIEAAQKVIVDMKKGDASSEDADKAIKDINDAVNGLKLPATTVDIEKLQEAIKIGNSIYNETVADAVSGRDELHKAVEDGKKVLESAKKGEANGQDVADAIKAIEDAIKNVKLNKQSLFDEVQRVQKLASTVYMTKEGEDKFVKAMTEIMNLEGKGIDYPAYEEAKYTLRKAEEGLSKQPNKADADKLIAAMNEVKALNKLPNHGKDLANVEEVGGPYSEAVRIMEALQQDSGKENVATRKLTKADLEKATKDIQDALAKVEINKDALNKFIKSAKDLEAKDDKFANSKQFKEAVVALELAAKDTKLSNLPKIMEAAQKVYKMMMEDLKAVVDGVLPWNNNQHGDNPAIKPVEVKATKAAQAAPSVTQAVAGTALTGEQFAQSIIAKEGHVADYYTKESYEAFSTALGNAETLIKSYQTKDHKEETVSLEDQAQAGAKVNAAMKDLADAQANLRFDRAKMTKLAVDGKKAKVAWQTEAMKTVQSGKKSTTTTGAVVDSTAEVTANATAANKGFYQLGRKLGFDIASETNKYSSNDGKDGWATEAQVAELMKPTKANAETLTKLVYAAENGYYTYCETVTVQAPAEKGE